MNWHISIGLTLEWWIGHGLADWLGGLALDCRRFGPGLTLDWRRIGAGLTSDRRLIDIGLA